MRCILTIAEVLCVNLRFYKVYEPMWHSLIMDIISLVIAVFSMIFSVGLGVYVHITRNENNNCSGTINQAKTIIVKEGLDTYAVVKIAKDVTEQELREVVDVLSATVLDVQELSRAMELLPKIHIGKDFPKDAKDGDIFLCVE